MQDKIRHIGRLTLNQRGCAIDPDFGSGDMFGGQAVPLFHDVIDRVEGRVRQPWMEKREWCGSSGLVGRGNGECLWLETVVTTEGCV